MTPSVSYAGKPSKVGGTMAGIAGWMVLVIGLSAALGIGLVLSLISATLGLAIGLPMGILTLAVSLTLLFSGKSLRKSGEEKQMEMRRKAVFALAMNRGGAVTAGEAAAALDIPTAEADAFLTDLAKTRGDEVTVELDDRGGIYYAFPRLLSGRPRSRIASEDGHVRVSGIPDTFQSEGFDDDDSATEQRRQKR